MIIQDSVLSKTLDTALSLGADFAEVFAERSFSQSLSLKDSKPSESISGQEVGAGVRLFSGTEQIYAYTNDLSEESLIRVARSAAKALKNKTQGKFSPLSPLMKQQMAQPQTPPWEASLKKKLTYLHRYDKAARAVNSAISQVIANVKEVYQEVQIANSEGINVYEIRPYSTSNVSTIAEASGQKETGYERTGFLATGEAFETVNFEELAKIAGARAVSNLTAEFAPAGEMPVVINNAFGGVIFHEACGHGLETTSVAKNASVFCGKLDQKIANECVTAIDDGTLENTYGSLAVDDEGSPTQKTTLIENGILKSYMVDKMGSRKTGYAMTGSGRRESYRFAPTSRMRNTFIDAGDSSLEEMIADVDHGLYAKRMGGGSVTPATGAYNFAVSEAYLIKNGKIDKQVKGASLIGTGIETLGNITKVGKDLELATGTCGSVSGWVPVTVGQPSIQVSKLTVGGRAS